MKLSVLKAWLLKWGVYSSETATRFKLPLFIVFQYFLTFPFLNFSSLCQVSLSLFRCRFCQALKDMLFHVMGWNDVFKWEFINLLSSFFVISYGLSTIWCLDMKHIESIIEQSFLNFFIQLWVRMKWRRMVYFQYPRLKFSVQKNIESKYFEATLIWIFRTH